MKRNKVNFNVYYMVKYTNGPKKGQIEDGNCIISQEYKNETNATISICYNILNYDFIWVQFLKLNMN